MAAHLEKPIAWMCACGKRYPCPDAAVPNQNYTDSACIHAEMNALLYADRDHTEGATLYCTDKPCPDCFKHIRASGVIRIKTPDFEWNKTPTVP
jgi:deoxycytidylate deaminase